MDLSAIIDEFNRRKAQAGQRIGEMFTLPKKPDNWFEQMQQTQQNAVTTSEQRANIHKELADIAERMAAGIVPEPIRARERAMRTDPSAAAKPFTSEEVKGITPFVTAAAPIAYHGTPHQFDKFDASKIGTGQGAQSYGHGLYFAENPQVAASYELAGQPVWKGATTQGHVQTALETAKANKLSGVDAKKFAMDLLNERAKNAPPMVRQQFYDAINNFDELATGKTGNMYQVNIPDQHAARMLDWDKPLSEQAPEVQKALADLRFPDVATGNQIWDAVKNRMMSRLAPSERKGLETYGPAASEELKRRGIPGIKYLDQGSRPGMQVQQTGKTWAVSSKDSGEIVAGGFPSQAAAQASKEFQGTRNFVVFDPAILEDVTRK